MPANQVLVLVAVTHGKYFCCLWILETENEKQLNLLQPSLFLTFKEKGKAPGSFSAPFFLFWWFWGVLLLFFVVAGGGGFFVCLFVFFFPSRILVHTANCLSHQDCLFISALSFTLAQPMRYRQIQEIWFFVTTSTCPSSPFFFLHIFHMVSTLLYWLSSQNLYSTFISSLVFTSSETAAYLIIGNFFIRCKDFSFTSLQSCKALSSGVLMKAHDLIGCLLYIVSTLISTKHPLRCW